MLWYWSSWVCTLSFRCYISSVCRRTGKNIDYTVMEMRWKLVLTVLECSQIMLFSSEENHIQSPFPASLIVFSVTKQPAAEYTICFLLHSQCTWMAMRYVCVLWMEIISETLAWANIFKIAVYVCYVGLDLRPGHYIVFILLYRLHIKRLVERVNVLVTKTLHTFNGASFTPSPYGTF